MELKSVGNLFTFSTDKVFEDPEELHAEIEKLVEKVVEGGPLNLLAFKLPVEVNVEEHEDSTIIYIGGTSYLEDPQ